MNLIKLLRHKYQPVFRNDQFRILLTIIGITIASLIFLLGSMVIDSIRYNLYEMIDELPDDVIVHQNISNQDYNYLRKIEDNGKIIPFETTLLESNKFINRKTYRIKMRVIGTHNDFVTSYVPYKDNFPVSKIKQLEGRVWTSKEAEQKLNLVVITFFTSKIFFGDVNPLGKEILIPGYGNFTVIGVINDLKEYKDSYDSIIKKDSTIETPLLHLFIPLTTYKSYQFSYNQDFTNTLLQHHDQAELVRTALRKYEFQDKFIYSYTKASIKNDFEEDLYGYKTIFNIVLIFAIAFSFIIIVNTMLFSIKGRINEIGVRIALGASKRNILFQFIFEAFILGFLALLISLLLIHTIIQILNLGLIEDFSFTITFDSIKKCFLGFIATVLLSAILPAAYASKINVIDTLRLE